MNVFGKVPEFNFEESNKRGIGADAEHQGHQLSECVGFMKTENKRKPLLRIVRDHAAKL
jgi:hypothetical protein